MSSTTNLKAARASLQSAANDLLNDNRFNDAREVISLIESLQNLLAEKNLDIVDGLSYSEREFVAQGKAIFAIKEIRARTDVGLWEAKAVVEKYCSRHGIKWPA